MKKIVFIAYYGDDLKKSERLSAPASDAKIEYIVNTAIKVGYQVEVLSMCDTDDRNVFFSKQKGYVKKKNGFNIRYFDSYNSKFKIIRVLGRMVSRKKKIKYIKENVSKECKVILYHSLSLMDLYSLLKNMGHRFTIDVEELYADVMGNLKLRKREIDALKLADSYIFPTQMLSKVINMEDKPEVIVHGTYKVNDIVEKNTNFSFDNSKIHCLYAGTFDPRKGGVYSAIEAARYLDSSYHLHILGFGTDDEIADVKRKINSTITTNCAKLSYDGLLKGNDYIAFLQNCDIGLSTQNPNAAFNDTSFPSKILSYLANGLHVVSVRIPVVEQSAIADIISFYDKQEPEKIAEAIRSVDLSKSYDSRSILFSLDKEFTEEFEQLMEE